MKVRNYQDLVAWQRAMDLVEDVYRASKDFPREEIYALTSQIRQPQFRFHQILRKVKEGDRRLTFFVTCRLLTAPCEKLKRKF